MAMNSNNNQNTIIKSTYYFILLLASCFNYLYRFQQNLQQIAEVSSVYIGILYYNSCSVRPMECRTCRTKEMLVCESCYNHLQTRAEKYEAEARQQQKNKQLQEQLKAINIAAMIRQNEAYKKKEKIRKVKQKIAELKHQIVQQKCYAEKLQDVKKFQEQYLTVNQSFVQNLYLEDLLKKNAMIKKTILTQKKQKKTMVDKIASVFAMEEKKYKIPKYLRMEQSKKNIIFTLQNKNYGIPVIKANNEQVITYHPLEQHSQMQMEEQQMLVNTLKVSSKLVVLAHKIFFSQLKLPYKMYFSHQYLYVGNSMVCFDSNLQLSSQLLLNVINILQANVEYIAFTIGTKQKPFLTLDRSFYEELQKKQFNLSSKKELRWKSFLKALKPSQIMQHCEQDLQSQLIVLQQYKKSQDSDDEYFELLQ